MINKTAQERMALGELNGLNADETVSNASTFIGMHKLVQLAFLCDFVTTLVHEVTLEVVL